jgi:hypothetical protein
MQATERRYYTPEEYLEVEISSEIRNEYHYSKTNMNQWLLSGYEDPNFVLSFTSFEFQLSVKELYDEVSFDAIEEELAPS